MTTLMTVTTITNKKHEQILSNCSDPEPYMLFNNALERNKETQKTYIFMLDLYMKSKKVKNVNDLLNYNKTKAETSVINFIVEQKKRGLSFRSLNTAKAALTAFYYFAANIELSSRRIKPYLGEKTKVNDRGYTRDEINKILDVCDVRTRAIILLLISSGVRIGALPSLKVGDLEKIKSVYKITVYADSNDEYETFCTPECVEAIDAYLAYRKGRGEIVIADSPLFREVFNRKINSNKPKHLTLEGLKNLLDNLIRNADLDIKRKNGSIHRNMVPKLHGFRKFCATEIKDMNMEIRELLLGHSIGEVKSAYVKYSTEDKVNEYLKHMHKVTMNQEANLEAEVKVLKNRESEVEQMKKKIQLMEQTQAEMQLLLKDPVKLSKLLQEGP